VACYELHTFSSLNREFLQQYRGKFKDADLPIVFFDPKTVESKKLPALSASDIQNAFGMPRLKVITSVSELERLLMSSPWASTNLLLMSSGNFGGMNIEKLTRSILG
jgi:UDP-N-acetylmuramate: L-alanyl-gamma-D-glutamyl-meso-diaminopimelate ligase